MWLRRFFIFFILLSSLCLGILFNLLGNPYVDFTVLEKYDPGVPSVLLDDEGNEWARFEYDKRKPVLISDTPKHLIDAFLASEDREFFNHLGLSFKGILRSALVNLRHGRIFQGGSAITQQLEKHLFFDSKKT